MDYTLGKPKGLKFSLDIPKEIENPSFRLKVKNKQQKIIFSEKCDFDGNHASVNLELDTEPGEYFIELERVLLDSLSDECLFSKQLIVKDNKDYKRKPVFKKREKKQGTQSELINEYEAAKYIREKREKEHKKNKDIFTEYDKTRNLFLESIMAAAVAPSQQTRAVGKKDGIITRLAPSASIPQPVTEDDLIFIQAIDFVSRINPDLFSDDLDLDVFNLLDDIIYFSDNLLEDKFNKRVSGSHKIALKRYQRNHKIRIAMRQKRRKKTIKGIIDDKKRKKFEKLGLTKDLKTIKKNHISTDGKHRRAK